MYLDNIGSREITERKSEKRVQMKLTERVTNNNDWFLEEQHASGICLVKRNTREEELNKVKTILINLSFLRG